MVETIVEFIIGLFSGFTELPFGKEIVVFIISLMPILELRGGLIAAALLDLNPVSSYIISIIGNILPVPFILWFIRKILDWMRNKKMFKKIVKWVDKKVESKKHKIEKYGVLGITLFVGIPLPGTGAWTGSLIAAMLDMDKKKAFIAAFIGVLLAGIIMSIFSYGILDKIF